MTPIIMEVCEWLCIYFSKPHKKIYRIYLNDLVAKLNQNKLQKIENRSKIGKTERGRETLPAAHLGHLPVAGPVSARPVTVQPSCQSSSSPSPRSSCVLDARAPTPATSCFAVAASPTSSRRHGDVPDPLSLIPRSLDLAPPRSSASPL